MKRERLVEFSACKERHLRRVWNIYIDTDKADIISNVIDHDDWSWNDIESYLSIAEQLIACAWGKA